MHPRSSPSPHLCESSCFYEYSNEHPSWMRPRVLLFLLRLLSPTRLLGIVSFPLLLPLPLDGAKNNPCWCRKQRKQTVRGVGCWLSVECVIVKVGKRFSCISQFSVQLIVSRWMQNILHQLLQTHIKSLGIHVHLYWLPVVSTVATQHVIKTSVEYASKAHIINKFILTMDDMACM